MAEGDKNPVEETGRITVRSSKSVSLSGITIWGFSSVGRAPALQAGGQRFEPANLHFLWIDSSVG